VVEHKGKLAALVDGVPLVNVADRVKYIQARVPKVVDITLSRVLQDSPKELKGKVAGRPLVVVRSTEIDYLGETGDDHLARQSMETVIGNLARAARRLAAAGIEHFVITADHGHLFGLVKGDDMKTDAPGGDTLEVHRRCWIGRGGATPAGTVRLGARDLGYASDLEFVLPTALGVLKAGGDLSFHHGGATLQELVIPVLSFRIPAATATASAGGVQVRLLDLPERITNRMFAIGIVAEAGLFDQRVPVRVVLLSDQEEVGRAGMATNADFDRSTGVVSLPRGGQAHVGLMLSNDSVSAVRVVALDPESSAVLAESKPIPLQLLR
jgi:hypothetical protein